MTASYRKDGHEIYQRRRKKYTLSPEEIAVLKEIYNDEIVDRDYQLIDADFVWDQNRGYKILAAKFKEKLEAIRDYNFTQLKHPVKKFFSVFFTKNTARLETAIAYINYHTLNRLDLEDISSCLDESEDLPSRKLHLYDQTDKNTSFLFSAKNVLNTLKNQAKHFLFIPFGQIARLANLFEKKKSDNRKFYVENKIALKLNVKDANSAKNALMKQIDSSSESIIPTYPVGTLTKAMPDVQGIVKHSDLKALLENAELDIRNEQAYKNICAELNAIYDLETLPNLSDFSGKNKYVATSIAVIRKLQIIIDIARANATVFSQRNYPSPTFDLPIDKSQYNYYDKIVDLAMRDINTIKGLTPYTKFLTIFPSQDKETKIARAHHRTDVIVSPLEPKPEPQRLMN